MIDLANPINWLHPLNRGLVACYKVLPGVMYGAKLLDIASPGLGRANHGTLTNMSPPSATSGFNPTARLGGYGEMRFDGTNDYVTIADGVQESTTTFTMSAWAQRTGSSGDFIVAHYQTTTNHRAWAAQLASTGWSGPIGNEFGVSMTSNGAAPSGSNSKQYWCAGTNVTDGRWHHVAFTWERGTLRLFVDGLEHPTTKFNDAAFTSFHNSNSSLSIGSTNPDSGGLNFWTGAIDDVFLWNRALHPSEILEHYLETQQYQTDLYNAVRPVFYSIPLGAAVAQTISSAGAVASLEAFGSHRLGLFVLPSGAVSGQAFGTAILRRVVAPSGIASTEGFGTLALALRITPSSLASSEAFGTAGLRLALLPSGIASAQAFGTPVVTSGGLILVPSSLASGETFGTAKLVVFLAPSGLASGQAFGTARLVMQLVPSGLASGQAFGTPRLNLVLFPSGIASAGAFGTTTVSGGSVVLIPGSIASAEAFGSLTAVPGAVTIQPSGIGSAQGFGTAKLILVVQPSGVTSVQAFGSHTILPGMVVLLPGGIASGQTFGTTALVLTGVTVAPNGIASGQAFGSAHVQHLLRLIGINSGETWGTPLATPGVATVQPGGIATAQAFGTASLMTAILEALWLGAATTRPFVFPAHSGILLFDATQRRN